jgi:hypothetical protein
MDMPPVTWDDIQDELDPSIPLPHYTSGEDHHWWGVKHSTTTRKLMSEIKVGKNNPFYGKKHSKESRSKMGHQKRCRKIIIDNVLYNSQKEAAEILGKSKALISKWVKTGKAKVA